MARLPLETLDDDVEYLDYLDHLAFGGGFGAFWAPSQVVHMVQMVHITMRYGRDHVGA